MISLPSLAQLDSASPRVWLAVEPTDMRRGFDRLAEMARSVVGQDPRSGHLFVFRSRGGDRLKVLRWDRDGYATLPPHCPRERVSDPSLCVASAEWA